MLQRYLRLSQAIRFTHSLFYSAPNFTLRLAKNRLSHNRYGFLVSKRIDKRAVVRNTLKRKLRACVERIDGTLATGYDLLFVLKKEAIGKPTQTLCPEVEKALRKAKVLV